MTRLSYLYLLVLAAACNDAGGAHATHDAGEHVPPDAGHQDPPPADGGALDPTLSCDPVNEHLWHVTGSSADGKVKLVLDRCTWTNCAGGCGISQVYVALSYDGRSDAAKGKQITYTTSHHNWHDTLVAPLSDRVLKWRVELDESTGEYPPKMFVSVESRTGESILADTQILEEQTKANAPSTPR